MADKLGIYVHTTNLEANVIKSIKLEKYNSIIIVEDSTYGSVSVLSKRYMTLEQISLNLPTGSLMEFSVSSDELTLNITYSNRSGVLRIIEL